MRAAVRLRPLCPLAARHVLGATCARSSAASRHVRGSSATFCARQGRLPVASACALSDASSGRFRLRGSPRATAPPGCSIGPRALPASCALATASASAVRASLSALLRSQVAVSSAGNPLASESAASPRRSGRVSRLCPAVLPLPLTLTAGHASETACARSSAASVHMWGSSATLEHE